MAGEEGEKMLLKNDEKRETKGMPAIKGE